MKKFLIILLSIIVVIIIYGFTFGTSGLVVNEYKIQNKKIPDSFDGFKIIHLSDVHYGRSVNEKKLSKIINKINSIEPDLVVLTGDLLDKDVVLTNDDIDTLSKLLRSISANIGKFYISGNHDFENNSFDSVINNSNFTNMNDTIKEVYFEDSTPIIFGGVSSNLMNDSFSINQKLDVLEHTEFTDNFKILLMHEPDYIDDLTYDFDIILAGHSHNGQVRVPFVGPIITPPGSKKYFKPFYQLKNKKLYISSGIGTSTLDIRLFNRPSINLYRIFK